ncbi:MAG: helix-turn-helix transcriptional regulator [Acidimicrobiia bacterium]|nr:helix-turn-helix transcriptional regulator [Acidimicrobiia bacterium]
MDTLTPLVRVRQLARSGRAREIREAANLSYRELAGAINVDPSTLLRWEAGQTRPRGEVALQWLRVLEELEAAVAA